MGCAALCALQRLAASLPDPPAMAARWACPSDMPQYSQASGLPGQAVLQCLMICLLDAAAHSLPKMVAPPKIPDGLAYALNVISVFLTLL